MPIRSLRFSLNLGSVTTAPTAGAARFVGASGAAVVGVVIAFGGGGVGSLAT